MPHQQGNYILAGQGRLQREIPEHAEMTELATNDAFYDDMDEADFGPLAAEADQGWNAVPHTLESERSVDFRINEELTQLGRDYRLLEYAEIPCQIARRRLNEAQELLSRGGLSDEDRLRIEMRVDLRTTTYREWVDTIEEMKAGLQRRKDEVTEAQRWLTS